MFDVQIELNWFVIGEAIIGMHPLTNALITLFFLRPYRRALRKLFPMLNRENHCCLLNCCYNSIHDPKNLRQDGEIINNSGSLINVMANQKDSVTGVSL